MQPDDDNRTEYRVAHGEIERWLDGDAPWLTVTGLPEGGKSTCLAAALAGRAPLEAVRVIDPAIDGPVERAPGERIIAVSDRRGLHPGEQVVEVPLLSPDEAAAVLVDAIRRVDPSLAVAPDEPGVDAIVRELGGHPGALVRVARYATLMSLGAIAARLRQLEGIERDLVFGAGEPALDRRLDRLWVSLNPMAREITSRLVIFRSPFTVADAEAVLGTEGVLAAIDAARAVGFLRFRSGHLTMPVIVWRYLRMRRPPADSWHVARHCDHRAAQARDVIARLETEWESALADIERLSADLRALLEPPMLDRLSADQCCDVATVLAILAGRRLDWGAQASLLGNALRRAGSEAPAAMARVALMAAKTAHRRGAVDDARALLNAIRDDAVRAGEGPAWSGAMAWTEITRGHYAEAAVLGERVRVQAIERRDARLEAHGLLILGVNANLQGELSAGCELLVSARDALVAFGPSPDLLTVRSNLIKGYRRAGRLGAAQRELRTALSEAEALRLSRNVIVIHCDWAQVRLDAGEPDEARRLMATSVELAHRGDSRWYVATCAMILAEIAFEQGVVDEMNTHLAAVRLLNEPDPHRQVSEPAAAPLDYAPYRCWSARLRARAALRRGDLDEARAAMEAARTRSGEQIPVDQIIESCLLEAQVSIGGGARAHAAECVARARRLTARLDAAGPRTSVALMACLVEPPTDAELVERLVDGLGRRLEHLDTRRVLDFVWPRIDRALRREARSRGLDGAEVLVLDRASFGARSPAGTWVDFGRRRVLWAMLEELVGQPEHIDRDEIIARVWPGESIQPTAALNRLHNGLALLRKAGFGPWIVRDGERYGIRPEVQRVILEVDDLESPG